MFRGGRKGGIWLIRSERNRKGWLFRRSDGSNVIPRRAYPTLGGGTSEVGLEEGKRFLRIQSCVGQTSKGVRRRRVKSAELTR